VNSLPEDRRFWAIYVSVAISYVGVGLVAPLIAIVLSEHGRNSFIVGLVGTTMFATFTLASFPLGAAVDRVGPKPILVSGLVVYGVSILLFAFIRSTALFFACRALEGAGAAAISIATETAISQLSLPNERAKRMSYYALAVGIGWAAGPITGAALFAVTPAVPFVMCFGLSLLAAGLAALFVPRTGPGSMHKTAMGGGLSRKILVPMSAGALYGYLMSSLITLFPLYLKSELHIPEIAMGAIITGVIGGTIVSQVPIGHAADRFGKAAMLLICSASLAVIFILMAHHTDWRMFLATGALTGALGGGFYPVGLSMIGELVGKQKLGAATSRFTLAFGIGSLIGPSASGLAMTHFGDARWLFYLPSMLTALFVVELIMFARTRAR
jgi:MFS family permease